MKSDGDSIRNSRDVFKYFPDKHISKFSISESRSQTYFKRRDAAADRYCISKVLLLLESWVCKFKIDHKKAKMITVQVWFCKLWEDTRRTHSQNWYHWKIPVWSRWQHWWWIGVCYILNICGGNTRECQILHFSAKNPKFFLAYLIQLDITNIHLKFVYLFTKGRGSQYTSQHLKIYLKCTIFGFDRKFQCLWPVGQLWSFGHKLSVIYLENWKTGIVGWWSLQTTEMDQQANL